MNFIQKIWNNIVTSNDAYFCDKIAELQRDLRYNKNELEDLEFTHNVTIESFKDLNIKYNKLYIEHTELKESITNPIIPNIKYTTPEFLDTSKFPYLPSWKIYYYKNGMKTKKVPFTPSKFYRVWSDEMYRYFKNKTKGIKSFDKLIIKLRDLSCDICKYETDVSRLGKAGENWRMPTETYYGRLGDCEDSTILWITACNICGVNPERVFNATGYLTQNSKEVGHSFGLAKFEDGKWYVIETTSKRKPILLQGSKYKITQGSMLNGLSNWFFSGKSKQEQF